MRLVFQRYFRVESSISRLASGFSDSG